jgi:hypothetical protein
MLVRPGFGPLAGSRCGILEAGGGQVEELVLERPLGRRDFSARRSGHRARGFGEKLVEPRRLLLVLRGFRPGERDGAG